MGSLVNPRGWRLGLVTKWSVNFFNKYNYNFSYLAIFSYNFINLFLYLINFIFKSSSNIFYLNFFKIIVVNSNYSFNLLFFYYFFVKEHYFTKQLDLETSKKNWLKNLKLVKKKKVKRKLENFFYPTELKDKRKLLFLQKNSFDNFTHYSSLNFVNNHAPSNFLKKKKIRINFLIKELHWSIIEKKNKIKNYKIYNEDKRKKKIKKSHNFFFYFNKIQYNNKDNFKILKIKNQNTFKNANNKKNFAINRRQKNTSKTRKKVFKNSVVGTKHSYNVKKNSSLKNFNYLKTLAYYNLFRLIKKKKFTLLLNMKFNFFFFKISSIKRLKNFIHYKKFNLNSYFNFKYSIKKFNIKNCYSKFLKKKTFFIKNNQYKNLINFFLFYKILDFIKSFFKKFFSIFLIRNKFLAPTTNLYFLPKKKILSSALFTSYMLKKLKSKKLRIRFVIKSLVSILTEKVKKKKLKGFKFQISGRITKKDRALYVWERHFKTSLNSKSEKIDYSSAVFMTKFSTCMFKLWVQYT